MKKFIMLLLVVFSFSLMTGCAGNPGTAAESDSGKISVVTSFYPMYDFAVKVAGEHAVVTNLTPAGIEPHDWEPSSTDMITLEKADVFIYNGSGMEHWVDPVLSSLENKDLIVVEASKAISLLTSSEASADNTDSFDPHVWLDPQMAKLEMHAILAALIAADPEHTESFQASYDKYALDFDALDVEFNSALSAVPQKNIVVAHNAFAYLCNAYGLTQVPIEGLAADSEPDAARMSEIIDFVSKNNVKVIFFEELVSPKVAKSIAQETGSSTAVLNPLEGISDENQAAGEDYFSVMRTNLKTLVDSLTIK